MSRLRAWWGYTPELLSAPEEGLAAFEPERQQRTELVAARIVAEQAYSLSPRTGRDRLEVSH